MLRVWPLGKSLGTLSIPAHSLHFKFTSLKAFELCALIVLLCCFGSSLALVFAVGIGSGNGRNSRVVHFTLNPHHSNLLHHAPSSNSTPYDLDVLKQG